MFSSPKAEHKHLVEHQVAGKWNAKGFHEAVRASTASSESYSMDTILYIPKQNISPDTPFFKFLVKKPPTTIDDLFRWVDKYSMLENDVQAAS